MENKNVLNTILGFFVAIGVAILNWFKKVGKSIVNFFVKLKPSNIKASMEERKRRKKYIVKSCTQDKIFDVVNVMLICFFIFLIAVPMVNLFAIGFSDSASTLSGKVLFLPMTNGELGISLDGFKYVLGYIDEKGNVVSQTFSDLFASGTFLGSVVNTVKLTIAVTISSNLLVAICAYPLSKKDFPFKKGIMTFFIITMLFSPGIVPIYLLMSGLTFEGVNGTIQITPNLIGTLWPMIFCSICNVFNLLLIKTFYEGIPSEIEESAIMDGAGSLTLFFKIVVPMSLPVIATCCFFTIVGCINNYGGAIIFVGTDSVGEAAQPMALYVYKLLITGAASNTNEYFAANQLNITSATIILSIIPILCIYPFVIRYIKGGLTVGSVKG